MTAVKVAVIGAGVIGRTLATCFTRGGHPVVFGSRDPGRGDLAAFAAEIGAEVADAATAVDASDVVVFAVPGPAMAETVASVGVRLAGKIVVDAANNVGAPVLNSLAAFAEHAPDAVPYRAFNSLGWENFANPRYGDLVGDLLYSGPDLAGRGTVETLIRATGLRPVWVGDNSKAKLVDDFVALWFTLAFERGWGRQTGFKILSR